MTMATRTTFAILIFILLASFACDRDGTQESATSQESTEVSSGDAPEAIEPAPSRDLEELPRSDEPESESDESAAVADPTVAPAPSEEKDELSQADCSTMKLEIKAAIDALPTSCRKDSDCQKVFFNCPFGCGDMVSTSADLEPVKSEVQRYGQNCPICRYRCRPMGQPTCVERRCEATPVKRPKPDGETVDLW